MKRLLLCLALVATAMPALADSYVRGYTRRDGTYVQPHVRSSPNGTTLDNWTTRGNVNPYTGQPGTRSPAYQAPSRGTPYMNPYGTQRPCYGLGCN